MLDAPSHGDAGALGGRVPKSGAEHQVIEVRRLEIGLDGERREARMSGAVGDHLQVADAKVARSTARPLEQVAVASPQQSGMAPDSEDRDPMQTVELERRGDPEGSGPEAQGSATRGRQGVERCLNGGGVVGPAVPHRPKGFDAEDVGGDESLAIERGNAFGVRRRARGEPRWSQVTGSFAGILEYRAFERTHLDRHRSQWLSPPTHAVA